MRSCHHRQNAVDALCRSLTFFLLYLYNFSIILRPMASLALPCRKLVSQGDRDTVQTPQLQMEMSMNLLDLSDKLVLLTGGAGAIGRVIAKTLADHGARVAVNDIVTEQEAQQIFADSAIDTSRVHYFSRRCHRASRRA